MGNGSSVQAGRSSAGICEFCWSQPLQQQQQEAVVTEVVVEVAGGSGAGRADEEASRG